MNNRVQLPSNLYLKNLDMASFFRYLINSLHFVIDYYFLLFVHYIVLELFDYIAF